jgi:hypothetical protein
MPDAWIQIREDPATIIDAANSLGDGTRRIYQDPVVDWVPAADYLAWARRSLAQDDLHGRDSAVMYAKRAVCRCIDALMAKNHFARFAWKSYPDKIEMLTKVGIEIPGVVHELVINPRNDIEHNYTVTTAADATRAVELANLLLDSSTSVAEFSRHLLISIGSTVQFRPRRQPPWEGTSEPFSETDDPWLLVDSFGAEPKVMILRPRDGELSFANLRDFNSEQSIQFARLMRARSETPVPGFATSVVLQQRDIRGFLYHFKLAPPPETIYR